MKTRPITKFVRALTLAAAVAFAFAASATTYHWKGPNNVWQVWSTLSNWSTESATGADATALPGAGDTVQSDLGNFTYANFLIDADYAVRNFSGNYRHFCFKVDGWQTGDPRHTVVAATELGAGAYQYYDIYEGVTLVSSNKFNLAGSDASAGSVTVYKDGDIQLFGTVSGRHYNFTLKEGASMTFAPTTYSKVVDSNNQGRETFAVGKDATLNFPVGIHCASGAANKTNEVNVTDGLVIVGGDIVSDVQGYKFTFTGGKLQVTGDSTFGALASIVIPAAKTAEIEVAAEKKLRVESTDYGEGSGIVKTGAGTLSLNTYPASLQLDAGTVEIVVPDTVLSALPGDGGTVFIAAHGLAITGEVSPNVRFAVANGVFQVGDAVLTSTDGAALAKAKSDLIEVGLNAVIEGDTLCLAASDIKFNSTTVTNINDPTGWSNGEVPTAGKSAVVAGEGVVVRVTGAESAIPAWTELTIASGAKLILEYDGTVVCPVKLQDGGKLVVNYTATLGELHGALLDDSTINEITVESESTLKVPGGTKFANCKLDLRGSIVGTSEGGFTFGYASAGETARFEMAAVGGTITALHASSIKNAARIDFVVPEKGGTVLVENPIELVNTKITYNELDGMAFGLNNPSEDSVQIIADNTQLEVGADTYVAGGVNLVLKNGTVLDRKRNGSGSSFNGDDAATYNLYISNRGRITVDDGGELRSWITMGNGDKTKGAITFAPDEADYVGLEVLSGGVGYWWKCNWAGSTGNVRFAGGVFELYQTDWWGWGNRGHFFEGLHSLEIAPDTTMTIRGINTPRYKNANSTNMGNMLLSSPITGDGNLEIVNNRTGADKVLHVVITAPDNACTGVLKVLDGDNGAKVHFADKSSWSGEVVWDGHVDLIPTDSDHSAAAKLPTEVTFGALTCPESQSFVFRLWGGDEFKNDIVNMIGQGWGEGVSLNFAVQDGYEAKPGDEWCLGTIPIDSRVPATGNAKWIVKTEPIENNTAFVRLIATAASVDFTFNGGAKGVTDLTDPTAWACGSVPEGQDVNIAGEGVCAVVTADKLPKFNSIKISEGATLQVLDSVDLPSVTIDGRSLLAFGDNETKIETKMPELVTAALIDEESGEVTSLSRIYIATNATVTVAGGTYFKNVDFCLCGALVKPIEDKGQVRFGYAENGEVSYLKFRMDGGKTHFITNQDTNQGPIFIVCPEAGGTVVPLDDIVFRCATFQTDSWADWFAHRIGVNNPTNVSFNVIYDKTQFVVPWDFTFAGSSHVQLTNGTTLLTYNQNHGSGNSAITDNATLTVGSGCEVRYNRQYNAVNFAPSTEDKVVVSLVDGAQFCPWKLMGNGKGVFESANGIWAIPKAMNGDGGTLVKPYAPFTGLKAVDIAAEKQLTLLAHDKAGDAKWDRILSAANVPVTGSGSLVLSNATDNAFELTIVNGANTATGLALAAAEEGTMLRFADGANWAGTVVANGHVALTNLTDGAAATTVTFGNLRLESGEFPIRVSRDSNGALVCDRVNLTGAIIREAGDTGVILLTGAEPEAGEKLFFGTAPAGAWKDAVIKTASGRYVVAVESKPDEHGLVTVTGKIPTGFCITIQ